MISYTGVAIVLGYFIALAIVITIWGKAKSNSMAEYAVAGRGVPWYMMLFTVLGSWIVGSFYVADFGWAVMEGAVAYFSALYGLLGLIFYYYIAPNTWTWGKVHNLYSMPDFINLRYGDLKLTYVVALLSGFLFCWPWQVLALMALGHTATALTGGAIPVSVSMAFFAMLIAFYCIYGGMRSVVVTDFVQGLICSVIVMGGILLVINMKFGGFAEMFQQVYTEKPDFLVINDPKYLISILIPCTLSVYCWPELFNRIFLAKSGRDLKIVARLAPVIVFVSVFLLITLGVGGSVVPSINSGWGPAEGGFLTLFSEVGGPVFLAFACIVIIAAEMSSVDSQITAMGTIFAVNLIDPLRKEPLSDGAKVKLTKWFICLWMVFVYFISLQDHPSLITYSIVTAEILVILFPTIIMGILWGRGNALASWASIIIGFIVTGVLMVWPDTQEWVGGWGAGFTGFGFAMVSYIGVALASKKDQRVEKLFEEVGEYKDADSRVVS
jgi:SSS family solute:Na+ symporter